MKLLAIVNDRTFEIDIEQSNPEDQSRFSLTLNHPDGQEEVEAEVLSRTDQRWTLMKNQQVLDLMIRIEDDRVFVEWQNQTYEIDVFSHRDRLLQEAADASLFGPAIVKTQMPGKVVRVLKKAGDTVRKGEGIVVIEAMKMQNEIKSPRDGTVVDCPLKEGDGVTAGQILAEIE